MALSGGGNGSDSVQLSAMPAAEKITPVNEMVFASPAAEDRYFEDLEKSLNDKLNSSELGNADKCASKGLTQIILGQKTNEIMITETYNLSVQRIVIANSLNEQSRTERPVWALYSGGGVLKGTVYTAPAKPENAVFSATYTENGISRLALFRLKVIGLSSPFSSGMTYFVLSCSTYDLSGLACNLSNGRYINALGDPNTTWKLISGDGVLTGHKYIAPAKAETAIFTASYTEGGIVRAFCFRLKVVALISFSLGKVTDEVQTLMPYDLSINNMYRVAILSNGETIDTRSNPNFWNTRWTLVSGSGSISGEVYIAPSSGETAILTASETFMGVTQSATFRLKVVAPTPGMKIQLAGLTIDKATDAVGLGGTYDLGKLKIVAKYSNNTTEEIGTSGRPSLSWIITTGGGSISGSVFNVPQNAGTTRFVGSFVAPDGSVKSAHFTLSFYRTNVYGNRGIVTFAGAKFHLNDGTIFEIPSDSITNTGEVSIIYPSDGSGLAPQQTSFMVNSNCGIKNAIVRFPVRAGTPKENASLTCLLSLPFVRTLHPVATINDTECVFVVKANPFASPSVHYSPLRAGEEPPDGVWVLDSAMFVGEKVLDGDTEVITCEKNVNDRLTDKNNKIIKWPYYVQYYQTGCTTAWLMLLKGYKKDLPSDFDSLYKILKYIKMPVDRSPLFYNMMKKIIGYAYTDPEASLYFPLSDVTIPGKTSQILGKNTKSYYFSNKKLFVSYVVNQLHEGIPVMVNFWYHTVIFVGYKYTGGPYCDIDRIADNISFIFHNPAGDFTASQTMNGLYQEKTLTELIEDVHFNNTNSGFIVHFVTSLPPSGRTLKTIHLPDDTTASLNNPGYNSCVRFVKTDHGHEDKKIAWTCWDGWLKEKDFKPIIDYTKPLGIHDTPSTYFNPGKSPGFSPKEINTDAYKWLTLSNDNITEVTEINDFDDIRLISIPIRDASNVDDHTGRNDASAEVALSIFEAGSGSNEVGLEILRTSASGKYSGGSSEYNFSDFKIKEPVGEISIGEKFRRDIKRKADFLMRIAVVNGSAVNVDLSNSANYCDKFDLKFTYVPPRR